MPLSNRKTILKIAVALVALGVTLTLASAFYASSFIAILGVAIVFWGAIFLYITPVKHIPLTLMTATANANTNNIERIIASLNLSERGVYLPPKNLKNIENSIIFLPKTSSANLPNPGENTEKLFSEQDAGVFLTPPGLSLSGIFEQALGTSFTKIDLSTLQKKLPILLVEDLEIAEKVEIATMGEKITFKVVGSILDSVCQETQKYPLTHAQVGCLLTSAIACVLAKATGRPVIIDEETSNPKTRTVQIEYCLGVE
jgi:hypothetical protein